MLLPAPFGLIYVPSRLIVPGDAAATASNVMASDSLFRLGIVSNLLVHIVNLFLVLALYRLLKPVNKNMASLMVMFVLVGVPIVMLNELTQLAVLPLLSGADYLAVFTTEQLHALVLLFLNLHKQGLNIAQIFWGLWLFPMGYLVFKSGFIPRILGMLNLPDVTHADWIGTSFEPAPGKACGAATDAAGNRNSKIASTCYRYVLYFGSCHGQF
jgi:hypothetical protein